jgi:hypothetical protein
MWRLKPSENEFQVTREGEFEYCKFIQGELYTKIPPEEAHRFESIGEPKETPKKKKGGD